MNKNRINSLVYLLSFLFMFLVIEDTDAQKKRRKSRTTDDESTIIRSSRDRDEYRAPWRDKLVYEVGIGNIGFFGGGGSSQFNFATKLSAGYKIFNRLTAGPYGKLDYLLINANSEDFNLLNYGLGVYSRFKLFEPLYLKAEYGLQSYAYDARSLVIERDNFIVPMVGAGYVQGFGKWKGGFEVMFNVNEEARDFSNTVVEYWLKFDYNF